MRLTRKLLLLAFTALAAMALAASTASAQGLVEITDEETGYHCTTIVDIETDGCQLTAVSDADVRLEAFGSLASACHNEYNATIDEDGHGYIYNQVLSGPDCVTPPCGGVTSPDPWEIEVSEDLLLGGTVLEAEFCVDHPVLGRIECHLPWVQVNTSTHQPTFVLNTLFCEPPNDFIHVTGSYSSASEGLEITHL